MAEPRNYLRVDPNTVEDGGWEAPAKAVPASYDARMNRRTHPADKGRYDLLPAEALRAWALRLEAGATVHPERGFEFCTDPASLAVFKSKAMRHLTQAINGEVDEDHLAAVLCNVGFLIRARDRVAPADVGPRVGG